MLYSAWAHCSMHANRVCCTRQQMLQSWSRTTIVSVSEGVLVPLPSVFLLMIVCGALPVNGLLCSQNFLLPPGQV